MIRVAHGWATPGVDATPSARWSTLPSVPRLDPTLDLVFKLLLTRQPALLRDMLEGVLARPIHDFTIIDSSIPGEQVHDRQIIFDIHVVLDDGSRVDLEMQRRLSSALDSRLVYYATRDYSSQLYRGDSYHLLTPTIGIVWLVDAWFPTLQRLHSIVEFHERFTKTPWSDQISIHLLQLPYLGSSPSPSPSRSGATRYTATVERWARFFTAKDDAALHQLASEHPIMSLAKQTLDHLSFDPEIHRRAREREDERRLHQIDMHAFRAEGKAEGMAEGMATMLLKMLGLRFGPLPGPVHSRVEAATPEQLHTWAERVLKAATLDEVFTPTP